MNRKHRIYESLMHDFDEREKKPNVLKSKPKTASEIEGLVYKYRALQLSMLEDYHLTKKEKAVAFYILFGISYLHISKLMMLEKSTVSFHARNIFEKCHVGSRQDFCLLVLTKMYFAGRDREDLGDRI